MTLYRTYKEAKDAPAKAAAKSKCEAAEESLTFESIRNFRYVVDKRMAAELAATQAAIAASPSTGALQSPSKAAVAAGWVSSLRAWGRGAPTAAMTLNKEDVDRLYDLLDDQTSADDSSLPEDDVRFLIGWASTDAPNRNLNRCVYRSSWASFRFSLRARAATRSPPWWPSRSC